MQGKRSKERGVGMAEFPGQQNSLGEPIERRNFLRKAAIAAWSTPVIVSVVAASPANAQTVTCVPPGRPCTPEGLPCCHRSHRCRLTGSGYRCVGPPPGKNDPGGPN